jgi:hypothetical protein
MNAPELVFFRRDADRAVDGLTTNWQVVTGLAGRMAAASQR